MPDAGVKVGVLRKGKEMREEGYRRQECVGAENSLEKSEKEGCWVKAVEEGIG